MRRFLWMCYLSYMLIGLAHVVIGSLLTVMLGHYERDYSDGGMLIFVQFAGFLIGVLTTPWWARLLSKRGAMLLALGSLFIAEAVFSFLPPWYWILCIAPLAGFGFGMIEALVGALVIESVKENKAVEMSRLEVAFGIGALIMPLLAGFFIIQGYWQASFIMVSLTALGLAIVFMRVSFGSVDVLLRKAIPTAGEKPHLRTYEPKQRSILVIFIALFLLYVGIEMSLVNFMPAMLIANAGISDAMGTLSVTFFWSTMVIGRFFTGYIAEKVRYFRFLLFSAIGTVVFLSGFSLVTNLWVALMFVLLLGLFMSGMFAILLLFANHLLPGMTEKTTSILIASGGIGGACLPLFTGWSMANLTVDMSLWVIVGLASLMLLLIVFTSRHRST